MKKHLVFIASFVVLVVAGIALFADRAAAGGPGTVVFNSNKFAWHVQWSQPLGKEPSPTSWSLRSFFSETVQMSGSGSTFTVQTGPDGGFLTTLLTDVVFSPLYFSFMVQGADTPVAETQWYTRGCPTGPEYFALISEWPQTNDSTIQLIVHNTTGKRMLLAAQSNASVRNALSIETKALSVTTVLGIGDMGFWPLPVDGWATVEQRVSVDSREGIVSLQSEPTYDLDTTCSTFSWYFPAMINLELTPAPSTPTPTPTPAAPVTVTLNSGWNNIAVLTNGPRFAQDVLTELSELGLGPIQISRWEGGGWESHLHNFPANSFPLEPGRGYFVRVERAGVWVPGRAIVMSTSTPLSADTQTKK
ncbi:MAG: hypothetical protein A2694_01785 [Candidatus Blackburnbacteria bacterium RIFCSPHIGHO2_01_FULL_40_17]|uniref:Fibronectin type-III domain-containing protein n=1 Tax=Candidatus Blackburnbacteria bacterium RIFCSPLOWO2_01_FULL_40_20 TaxID=1797519 RepID=A0A1G1VC17_9BACT|nr:MAG: hypothetical protein A2694_01785 [Candidatus Blackburnbacteria bacterium RIFCSPHIGHO2_01_FULL_40_17]OGY12827.1 MAG: hypothetical protein A3A77_03045 [Candidatus Blackburnbacteria bacterium RIFCSPLOWO2_01_FULL_40_20]